MGNRHIQKKLPENLKQKCINLFKLIDVDGSLSLDKEETVKFWQLNFPILNSIELFEHVDFNNDGLIQINEWIEFWTRVYNSGYHEKEISLEIDKIMSGGSWVRFNNIKANKPNNSQLFLKGKY